MIAPRPGIQAPTASGRRARAASGAPPSGPASGDDRRGGASCAARHGPPPPRNVIADPAISPARARRLTELATRLGHEFADLGLLDRALCHASTGNERRDNYERLEFLGDAILGYLVADILFHRTPEIPVGELSERRARVVSRRPLARVARRLGLGDHLTVGRGIRSDDIDSPRILADLVEAVVAAVHLDGGLAAARAFVEREVLGDADAVRKLDPPERDPKSRLMHLVQTAGMALPTYETVGEDGPPHQRTFEIAVVVEGERLATATGRTKRDAEKRAAGLALETLGTRLARADDATTVD